MSANVTDVVPFFWVSDMERSLRYYVDGLGFSRTKQWVVDGKVRWCWLVLGGSVLMLQELNAAALEAPGPGAKTGEGVSLYFQCKDALEIYHEVLSRGIAASEPQVGNGLWETSLRDPDGYRLHFTSATDLPEDTVLSEVP